MVPSSSHVRGGFFSAFAEANHKLMFADSKLSKTGDLDLWINQLSKHDIVSGQHDMMSRQHAMMSEQHDMMFGQHDIMSG